MTATSLFLDFVAWGLWEAGREGATRFGGEPYPLIIETWIHYRKTRRDEVQENSFSAARTSYLIESIMGSFSGDKGEPADFFKSLPHGRPENEGEEGFLEAAEIFWQMHKEGVIGNAPLDSLYKFPSISDELIRLKGA